MIIRYNTVKILFTNLFTKASMGLYGLGLRADLAYRVRLLPLACRGRPGRVHGPGGAAAVPRAARLAPARHRAYCGAGGGGGAGLETPPAPTLSCPTLSCPTLSCPTLSFPTLSCPIPTPVQQIHIRGASAPVNSYKKGASLAVAAAVQAAKRPKPDAWPPMATTMATTMATHAPAASTDGMCAPLTIINKGVNYILYIRGGVLHICREPTQTKTHTH